VTLKPDTPPERVAEILAQLKAIPFAGLTGMTIGVDAGLREGNAGAAVVSDFEDEASYRAYDADAEHNRVRRELAPMVDHIERCQIRF
jgi:hypothetical protein